MIRWKAQKRSGTFVNIFLEEPWLFVTALSLTTTLYFLAHKRYLSLLAP